MVEVVTYSSGLTLDPPFFAVKLTFNPTVVGLIVGWVVPCGSFLCGGLYPITR